MSDAKGQALQATWTTKEEGELGNLKALLGSLSKRTLEKVQTQEKPEEAKAILDKLLQGEW